MDQWPGTNSPPSPEREPLSLIRASELAQYSFCHRAWWLGTVKGLPSASRSNLARGVRHHQSHEQQVHAAGRWRRLGLILLGSGLLLLIGVILLGLWG
jgi:hypothetical protein